MYSLPVRPHDMTLEQLDKFRDFMRGTMSAKEEDDFYNELVEYSKKIKSEPPKRKLAIRDNATTTAPLLDEEEVEILKRSKIFEDDETETETKNKEKEAASGLDFTDYEDYLKEFDFSGGKRIRKTRKMIRKHKKSTKKHHIKPRTHKRKMHKKRRTHRKR